MVVMVLTVLVLVVIIVVLAIKLVRNSGRNNNATSKVDCVYEQPQHDKLGKEGAYAELNIAEENVYFLPNDHGTDEYYAS